MGRYNSNPEQQQSREAISSEQQIQHFSHPHALQLTNQPQYPNNACFACKVTLSGPTYSCLQCNYFLHLSCSQKPIKIKHPSDLNGHTLHLLSVPPYPEGTFCCDACGKIGAGFCYNCAQCGIDLHPTCASMPLVATHGSHYHQLNLTFSPPYYNKTFSCDLCRMTGSKHWLYRCHSCEFDAHLDCAMGKITFAAPTPSQPIMYNQQNYSNHGMQNQQQPMPQVNYGPVWPAGGVVNNAANGLVYDASQAVANNLMTGLLGTGPLSGGGGGGGGYYDGGYAEMTDLQTMNMADSADTMDSI